MAISCGYERITISNRSIQPYPSCQRCYPWESIKLNNKFNDIGEGGGVPTAGAHNTPRESPNPQILNLSKGVGNES
jgi:hypothetical protein